MATNKQLTVIFAGDSSQLGETFRQLGAQTGSLGDKFQDTGRRMSAVGRDMTTNISLPLAALGGFAFKAANDFESSFAGVRKTVDATEPEFAQLSEAFRNMAKQIPVNVNEINRIGEAAGALGVKREDILGFTRTIAMMGVTTNLTSDEAANSFARIGNIMGITGKDFDRLGSTIVDLGNKGASTESEIAEMAQRIAGAGKVVGLSTADVAGMASALASVGVEAEAGGSAMSRVMVNMAEEVAKGGSKLDAFAKVAGTSSAEFKQRFETDAAGAIVAFVEGLGKMDAAGGDVFGTLEQLGLSEVRVRDALLRLAGAGGLLSESLATGNKAWQENTALTEEAGKRFTTTESKLQLAKNSLNDVAITFGQSLQPAIVNALEVASRFLRKLDEWAQAFGRLSPQMQQNIIMIAGVVAALGPLLFVSGKVIGMIGGVIQVFQAAGVAFRVMSTVLAANPFLLFIAAVIGVVALVVANWERIKSSTQGLRDSVARTFENIRAAISDPIQTARNHVSRAIGAIKGFLEGLWNKVRDIVDRIKKKWDEAPWHRASPSPLEMDAIKTVQGINKAFGQIHDPSFDMGITGGATLSPRALGATAGGVVNHNYFTIEGSILTEGQFIEKVQAAFLQKQARGAALGF